MISFRKGLFVSHSAVNDRKKIISDILGGRLRLDVYVITLAACPSDVFDIIPAFMLNSDVNRKRNIHILGISIGRLEAYHLAGTMVLKAMEQTGNVDIRSFYAEENPGADWKSHNGMLSEADYLEPEYPETDFASAESLNGAEDSL